MVEVDADVCLEHDRWRHPTQFCRVRLDLQADEISGIEATDVQAAPIGALRQDLPAEGAGPVNLLFLSVDLFGPSFRLLLGSAIWDLPGGSNEPFDQDGIVSMSNSWARSRSMR